MLDAASQASDCVGIWILDFTRTVSTDTATLV